ncbi:PadR family transcriptional regulator [Kitasatospora purpeofusca]|uniref:PadR family transcriptional regulator n=1 Tax=Kitasatospora purpeofusca TaxID=67352 RepID=UPI002A5A27CF|nr:PadR family transcriptional regulator [Kitasatospora purpeofusca]MDY0809984.1 PadR family transcriptional regulator [Kitasatospora purpeofusca]
MTERSMREPTLLLLTALADAPRHGYALIQEIAAISQGRITMRASTLYSTLDRLLQQGFIGVESDEVVNGRARRTYALTDTGTATLAAETDRLLTVVAEADRRLRRTGAAEAGARSVTEPVFRLEARGALA